MLNVGNREFKKIYNLSGVYEYEELLFVFYKTPLKEYQFFLNKKTGEIVNLSLSNHTQLEVSFSGEINLNEVRDYVTGAITLCEPENPKDMWFLHKMQFVRGQMVFFRERSEYLTILNGNEYSSLHRLFRSGNYLFCTGETPLRETKRIMIEKREEDKLIFIGEQKEDSNDYQSTKQFKYIKKELVFNSENYREKLAQLIKICCEVLPEKELVNYSNKALREGYSSISDMFIEKIESFYSDFKAIVLEVINIFTTLMEYSKYKFINYDSIEVDCKNTIILAFLVTKEIKLDS